MAKKLIDTESNDKIALQSDLDKKANKSNINPGSGFRITYNSEGVITGSSSLFASDIPYIPATKINSGTFASARLPTATASAKGAVQPVAKTADMTQAVGVDSSGKLYTAPSGGGGSGGGGSGGGAERCFILDMSHFPSYAYVRVYKKGGSDSDPSSYLEFKGSDSRFSNGKYRELIQGDYDRLYMNLGFVIQFEIALNSDTNYSYSTNRYTFTDNNGAIHFVQGLGVENLPSGPNFTRYTLSELNNKTFYLPYDVSLVRIGDDD